MTAPDGRRAMQVLETEQPDILLLDVDLPEMDGYALAAHVRRVPRLKDVPILLLAGAFEPVDQARAREVGSDGVILKPFEPQVVVTRVKELIDQRDRMSAAPPPARGESPAAAAVAGARSAVAVPEPVRATPPPAPVEPPKPARPEAGFMRVAPRDRDREPEPLQEVAPVLDSLELPTGPIWEGAASSKSMDFQALTPLTPLTPVAPPAPMPVAAPPPSTAPPKVTLANAFTALLAAEQSAQPAGSAVSAISEASIEDAVRRVLVRMTDELVRRIVLDTAERLIREEIERIKANPD
jgi:CheY-like chemotaxis protein